MSSCCVLLSSLIRCNLDGGGTGPHAGALKLSCSFLDTLQPQKTDIGVLNTGVRAVFTSALATGIKDS